MKNKRLRDGVAVFAFWAIALAPAQISALAGSARPHPLPAPRAQEKVRPRVKENVAVDVVVSAVTIAVTVQDRNGKYVADLAEKDFSVYEDDQKRKITYFSYDNEAPLSLTVLLDVSGSMALEDKLAECKEALKNLADNILKPRDEIALLIFADGDVEVASKHSTDKSRFLEVLEQTEAYGQTALNDAVAVSPEFATRALNEKRALLLITDGIENDSQATAEQALKIARRVDVPIYTIGYKIPRSEQALLKHKRSAALTSAGIVETLDRFSLATGGKAFFVNQPLDLYAALREIAREQGHQYIIGYTTYIKDEDIYRRIRVLAGGRKLRIRTREGY